MQISPLIVIFSLYWSCTTADDVNVIRLSYSSSNAGSLVRRQDLCDPGYFACSDGGCCAVGTICATVDGAQVCESTTPCTAPPVPCGIACCNAGSTCVSEGGQFRCQLSGDVPPAPAPAPVPSLEPAPEPTSAPAPAPAPVPVPAPAPITIATTGDVFGTSTQLFGTTAEATTSNVPAADSLASTEQLSIILASIVAVVGIGFMVFGH